jgi:hypothetical protein
MEGFRIWNLYGVRETYRDKVGQISYLVMLYFLGCSMFKLGFFTSPETNIKQVFLECLLPMFFSLV